MRPCRLGDIALLAPVGTQLWRFEEALEDRGVTVSTQAGKGFFHRQEIQNLIALTRTLADGRDTLALGALLRGPLVGFTEAELLDIAEALPLGQDRRDRLSQLNLWTDPEHIRHDLARLVIRSLQSLAMRVPSTTPYALLSEAVGILNVRSQLRQRFKAAQIARLPTRTSYSRWRAPLMFVVSAPSPATCVPIGKTRLGKWKGAPMPRSNPSRSSPFMRPKAWNGQLSSRST